MGGAPDPLHLAKKVNAGQVQIYLIFLKTEVEDYFIPINIYSYVFFLPSLRNMEASC